MKNYTFCEISCAHGGECECGSLLGCCAVLAASFIRAMMEAASTS
jgi:hypothetical protein